MEEKQKQFSIPLGSSSLLMIFIVLCFTVFAVLAFVSARHDFRFSEKAAASLRAYYEADAKGEEQLSSIAQILDERKASEEMTAKLKNQGVRLSTDNEGRQILDYTIPVQGQILLSVRLQVLEKDKEPPFEILYWKTINTHVQSETEAPLDLWVPTLP